MSNRIKKEFLELINKNKCPCCERPFEERKTVSRNKIKCFAFYIPSWAYSQQKWGNVVRGRWHLITKESLKYS